MAGNTAKKGKKHRKFGRNAKYCAVYAAAGVETRNARRRLRRHLRRCGNDDQARRAYIANGGKEAGLV